MLNLLQLTDSNYDTAKHKQLELLQRTVYLRIQVDHIQPVIT